jgi:hypothetical protein
MVCPSSSTQPPHNLKPIGRAPNISKKKNRDKSGITTAIAIFFRLGLKNCLINAAAFQSFANWSTLPLQSPIIVSFLFLIHIYNTLPILKSHELTGPVLRFFAVEEGRAVLVSEKPVDKSQAYFWTRRWQKGEREADQDIKAGRTKTFGSVDELIKDSDKWGL